METPSFFSRATGTLGNPLSKAVDSVREVIAQHAGDPDEKLLLKNMLQLALTLLKKVLGKHCQKTGLFLA